MSTITKGSGGTSLLGLLTVVFVVLKLTGVISWSWWWVTAPLWGSLAVVLAALIVAVSVASLVRMWFLMKPSGPKAPRR